MKKARCIWPAFVLFAVPKAARPVEPFGTGKRRPPPFLRQGEQKAAATKRSRAEKQEGPGEPGPYKFGDGVLI